MDWYYTNFDGPVKKTLILSHCKMRKGASTGIWLTFLLPICIIMGYVRNIESQEQYFLCSVIATGIFGSSAALLLYLIQCSKTNSTPSLFSPLYLVPFLHTSLLLYFYCEKSLMFSLFGGILSTFPICIGLVKFLQLLPGSFTYGEAVTVIQTMQLFLFSIMTNIKTRIGEEHLDSMEKSTLIVQIGMLGLLVICLAVAEFPNLRQVRPFSALIIGIMGGAVVPILSVILHENPVLWIVRFIFDDLQRVYLIIYWIVCSGVAIMAVCTQIQDSHQASTGVRKTFHLLVLAVFLPGLAWECTLLYLASGIAFAALIFLETIRLAKVGQIGENLQQGFLVFADDKDSAGIALTPLYLLLGCSSPLWLHPSRCAFRATVALPVLSGLLSVGAGDTAASIFGIAYGKHKWKGSPKSIEGTIACVVGQILTILLFIYVGHLPLTMYVIAKSLFAIIVVSLAEALMDQVDNLALPLLMYILLV